MEVKYFGFKNNMHSSLYLQACVCPISVDKKFGMLFKASHQIHGPNTL